MDQRGERGKAVVVEIEYDSLDKLRVGANSIIRVMVCQTWDVTNAYGRYRSTEYVSDAEWGFGWKSCSNNLLHGCTSRVQLEYVNDRALKLYMQGNIGKNF